MNPFKREIVSVWAMVKLHYFKNQRYSKLKSQCEKEERLFEDPEFPANDKSIFFSHAPQKQIVWRRPKVWLKPFYSLVYFQLYSMLQEKY